MNSVVVKLSSGWNGDRCHCPNNKAHPESPRVIAWAFVKVSSAMS